MSIPDGHAVTRVKGKEIRMHRVILDVPDDMDTDHKNHYRADNRKCNIRPCTVQENSRNRLCPKNNTTGVRGVTWCKASRKWRVRIMVDGENLNLGFYDEFEKAVQVRHTFEHLFYGEFACIMPPVQI